MLRVAVMQPYFFPYAGYFRLFDQVDHFVIFDCVQFPRSGRVHRTQVPAPNGGVEWLTLPLLAQPRSTLIRNCRFSTDARARFDERLRRLAWISAAAGPLAGRVRGLLRAPLESVIDYVEESVRLVAGALGYATPISRSSALEIDPELRGQRRVIAVASALGATHYVNAAGGRALYDRATFARAGIDLSFVPPYDGPHRLLLPALMTLAPHELR
ncbi:MAG: WbqC family protein [Candidatus Eremiobacteraeota bacterium]|nr:WbqC family protein [Candidatus Eremiobacteraeota bacterium]